MSKKPANRAETAISRRNAGPNLQEQRRMHALSEAIKAGGGNHDHTGVRTVETARAFEGYLSGKAKE